jgi:hypothetical protein
MASRFLNMVALINLFSVNRRLFKTPQSHPQPQLRFKPKDRTMPARFADTITNLQKGAKGMTISAAVKNIENWEKSVSELDQSGAKTLLHDLGALKKALQKEEPDGKAVLTLVEKLGKETLAMSKKTEGPVSGKLEEVGNLLSGGLKA